MFLFDVSFEYIIQIAGADDSDSFGVWWQVEIFSREKKYVLEEGSKIKLLHATLKIVTWAEIKFCIFGG